MCKGARNRREAYARIGTKLAVLGAWFIKLFAGQSYSEAADRFAHK
jgi:hypothetical protein